MLVIIYGVMGEGGGLQNRFPKCMTILIIRDTKNVYLILANPKTVKPLSPYTTPDNPIIPSKGTPDFGKGAPPICEGSENPTI